MRAVVVEGKRNGNNVPGSTNDRIFESRFDDLSDVESSRET